MEKMSKGEKQKMMYLPKVTLEKPRAFLAHNRLVNPFLVSFSKMTNL